MPRPLDPAILEVLKKYHPEPKRALWDCHGTWVVYHKDVELIAAKAGVMFDPPMIIEANGPAKCAAVCVTGRLPNGVADWSIGEAAPGNNKNAYPYAMAEKRARDRIVLKLLGLHGVYSSEESDKFSGPPAKSAFADGDVVPADQYFTTTLRMAQTVDELTEWAKANKPAISKLSEDDQAAIRDAYAAHRTKLAEAEYQKEAAE